METLSCNNIHAKKIYRLSGYVIDAQSALNRGDYFSAKNYLESYYSSQIDDRGYATLALHVINNDNIFGITANNNVENALGKEEFSKIRLNLMLDLVKSDIDTIIKNGGYLPTINQINNYHYDVYPRYNIPLTSFGGAANAALGTNWAPGLLREYEIDPDLTNNSFYKTFSPMQIDRAIFNIMQSGISATIDVLSTSWASPAQWPVYDIFSAAIQMGDLIDRDKNQYY